MKNKIIIGMLALLLVLVSVTLSVVINGMVNKPVVPGEAEAAVEEVNPFKEAKYLKLEPEFIVSFRTKTRPNTLMLEVSASTTNDEALAAMQQHMPAIRNNLLMLLDSQDPKALQLPEAKETLRQETLASLQEVMTERFGEAGVDDVFFTRFVMQ